MRPLSLTLRGFIGILSGLNREEVKLDLSGMSGAVALVGPNGCGKTTILDNLHPYRLMPYRSGGYSPRSFSFYEETVGDAYKELICEHGGETYRCELIIKGANKTKKTEAYLYIKTPDGWMPMRLPDNTVSDGKADTYDRCVNHVFGSPEMFFTAVFATQGRTQLSDYPAGEIKSLLSELLGLDQLLILSQQAEEAAKYQQARFAGMQASLQEFEAVTADIHHSTEQIAAAQADLTAAQTDRAAARGRVQKATQDLAEAKAKAANIDELKRRHQRLDEAVAAARRRCESQCANIDAEIVRTRSAGAAGALKADIQQLEAQRQRLLARRQQLETQRSAAPDLVTAEAALAAAEQSLTAAEQDVAAARAAVDALKAAASEVQVLIAKLGTAANSGKSLKADLDRVQMQAKLIQEVPCAALTINSECKLLQSAHAASSEAANINERLVAARDSYAQLQAERDTAALRSAGLAEAQKELAAKEQSVLKLRDDLRRCQAAVTLAKGAEAAGAEISSIEKELEVCSTSLDAKQADVQQAAQDAAAREIVLNEQRSAALADCTKQIDDLGAERADLPPLTTDGTGGDLTVAETEMRSADAALDSAERRITDAQTRLSRHEANLEHLERRAVGAEEARAEAAVLTEDIAQWRLLGKALGRDGVVALSIDDAGPSISSIANDLLLACYGPRFALRFDTLADKKDGGVKETFDIRVFDAERSDDKSVTKMSGGEKIWINEALTSSIGLFRAQASGQAYQCRFSDESDGALDPERKHHFMKMKRRVLELGGYQVEFYITHTPELWEMADSIIDVAALRITH